MGSVNITRNSERRPLICNGGQEMTMVDSATFRDGMSHLATAVTIVSTRDPERQPYGITVSSFASLSLEPPLIQWSIKETSYSFPIFAAAEMFAVNILSSDQDQISRDFCRPIDRFATVDWEEGFKGMPLIRGAAAWIECAREDIIIGGDHRIFVGRVMNVRTFGRSPLVYWRGQYGSLAQRNSP
jgi:flavin reductase (DIM6/NTAB) family NADH-FMN oxidoreductase RutF